jgi:ornithine--oxo-acid transaminase
VRVRCPDGAAAGAAQVLREEKLAERAEHLGRIFRARMGAMKYAWIKEVRGKGLLNAIEIQADYRTTAWDICLKLKACVRGLRGATRAGSLLLA